MAVEEVYVRPPPKADNIPLRIYSNPICPYAEVNIFDVWIDSQHWERREGRNSTISERNSTSTPFLGTSLQENIACINYVFY